MVLSTVSDQLQRIRDIAPVLRLNAAAGEANRAITDEAHDALVNAGLFDLAKPRAFGGAESDLVTIVRALREVSKADGSAGWCAMISGVYSSFAALLPEAGAREVFASSPTIIAGALGPGGQAIKVDGGYRVSGRWPFGSNAPHANWFCGGALVIENGAPIMLTPEMPLIRLFLFPREVVTIIDTWQTTGLKGTGSHDYAINDVFVPEHRTFWFSDQPRVDAPLYHLPVVASYGLAIAAVTVGIAEHMLEAFRALAPVKKPILSPLTLQEKPNVHDRAGRALATVRAAAAYLDQTAIEAYAIVERGGLLNWEERGGLWLAATHAAQMAYGAIEELYTISGASGVYASNDFDRCLRDARTAVQHVMTQFVNYETAGKQFLGLDVKMSSWRFDYRPGDPD